MNTTVKPALPKDFTTPSLLGTCGIVSYMLMLFLLPSAAVYYLLFESSFPLWLSILLSIPLYILSGQGMQLMGWIGHDGLHFNLHSNRIVSSLIGIIFSSPTATFVEMGMALDHWTHHRYTNLPEDPDLKLHKNFNTFWSRMILSRVHCNRHYMRRVYKLAANLPLDKELTKIILPFSRSTLRKLAIFNLSCNALFFVLYLVMAILLTKVFLVFVFAPMVAGAFLSGMRPYIEHNGTSSDVNENTRTRSHACWTLLDAGGNYHYEHHLYPNVPQWRLPRLHRYLKSQGYFYLHEDKSFVSHYKYLTSKYTYPKV